MDNDNPFSIQSSENTDSGTTEGNSTGGDDPGGSSKTATSTSLSDFSETDESTSGSKENGDSDDETVNNDVSKMEKLSRGLPPEFDVSDGHINHPFLTNSFLESRAYQIELFTQTRNEHSLIGLPTGLGKTTIASMAIADRLQQLNDPDGVIDMESPSDAKCLVMAPKKPLVSQHVDFFRDTIDIPNEKIDEYTGDTSPDNRGQLWDDLSLIVATPQVIENDIIAGRIDLTDVIHFTVDECHRATGNYPYVFATVAYHNAHGGNHHGREIPIDDEMDISGVDIDTIDGDVSAVNDELNDAGIGVSDGSESISNGMKRVDAPIPSETPSNACVLAMSASPGDNMGDIVRVCLNLGLNTVSVMTDEHPLVEPYIYETDVEWKSVPMDDRIADGSDALYSMLKDRLKQLKQMGYSDTASKSISKGELFDIKRNAQAEIQSPNGGSNAGTAISLATECVTIKQAIDKLEGQGPRAFIQYVKRRQDDAAGSSSSKYVKRFVGDQRLEQAVSHAHKFINDGNRHPKFQKAKTEIAKELAINDGERVMVFCEYRDTVRALEDYLSDDFTVERLVGQTDRDNDPGMNHDDQQNALNRFRGGDAEVLLTTSVSEEGIDIPDVDLVLAFEPVLESVRSVQRQGRTGRQRHGKVIVLMTEDTGEESKYWASKHRKKSMKNDMKKLAESEGGLLKMLSADGDVDTQSTLSEINTQSNEEHGESNGDMESDDGWDSVSELTDESEYEADDGEIEDIDVDIGSDTDSFEIVIDDRELDSDVARQFTITHDDIDHRVETLEVGDYICSDRVAVERKTVDDLYDTLTSDDRDLFKQAIDLSNAYDSPVYIIEGETLNTGRNIHPNAVYGIFTSLITDFGISILRTTDGEETANVLSSIVKREQDTEDREVSVHGSKGKRTLKEQQEYFISSIPDIGPVTAKQLLSEFGTPIEVLNASSDELMAIDGIGGKTVESIQKILTEEKRDS